MVAFGIARRTPWAHNAVPTDATDLRRLYVEQGLSMSALAERCGCSLTTIWRKLKAAGIESREALRPLLYTQANFSGDLCEKAYLIGFRLGDLHVALGGTTIVVKCTSTRTEQVDLFRALFERYGHVYTDEATQARRRRQSIGMSVRLNMTFDFLLPKQDGIPAWILGDDATFFAFFAGYLDAEGYVNTYLPKGYRTHQVRVEVRSYDSNLLQQLAAGLNQRGIRCPDVRMRVQAGYVNRYGVRSNQILWGLGICRHDSLTRLFEEIEPYVRHARRRRDMMTAWKAI
jgi:AcrR family transcriptional regulator